MADDTPAHFIAEAIAEDLKTGRNTSVRTRFPPEPNGFLHIGHAKAIHISFSMAQAFGGKANLRMDDTNPEREEQAFIDAIQEDIRWLGYEWDELCFASDYFEPLYGYAVQLIEAGLAYVDDQTAEEVKARRGTLTQPGENSPFRDRSVAENLDLLARMRAGEFPESAKVLRAKIDMAHPNLNMRDPAMYRIKHAHHHRTGDSWKIYPTYDFAHGQSDAIEEITHSLCSLEFEDHRPLYNWFIEKLGLFPSRQIEFARSNLTYTVMSKRKLRQMVDEGIVEGWDDPRMPTLSGFRRAGYTPKAIRMFTESIGVTKFSGTTEIEFLESCLRKDLEETAHRRMAVLDPLKVVITNLPDDAVESYDGPNLPADPAGGTRPVLLTREIFIERSDFLEDAPKKFFRLAPGREVRLRYACYITCTEVVKNDAGDVIELRAEMDPESRGASTPDGRKVKGTIHWVSATHSVPLEVRLYERLFAVPNPDEVPEGGSFVDHLTPNSRQSVTAHGEPALAGARPGDRYQFERTGYFAVDPDSREGALVFNRTVALKDSWGKQANKG